MSYGAAASTDPMDAYSAQYAQRLQSALAAPAAGDVDVSSPDNSSPSSLGPDTYKNPDLPPGQQTGQPPPSALAPQQPAPQGAPPTSALAAGDDGKKDSGQKDVLSFRDAWKKQTKAQRQQQMENFQDQLKQGNQSIDSAYSQMMQKLGTRPQTDLSKEDKGMLLMEFGMRMMRNSASPASGGFGGNIGAAAGQAGTDTFQTAQAMKAQKLAQAHQWDQTQTQLGIAQGKEKTNFAQRSLLEQGRDDRANQTADTNANRTTMQQLASGDRSDARIAGQDQRTAETIKAQNDRFFESQAGLNNRAAAHEAGLTARGNQKSALAQSGGVRGGAMKAAYDMYMSVHGTDPTGQPLPDAQLQQTRQEAMDFAANPSHAKMSNAQLMDMAEKDGNRQYAPGSIATMGMSEKDQETAKQAYINQRYQDLQRTLYGGGSAQPRSALSSQPPASPVSPNAAPRSALSAPTAAPVAPRGTPAAAPPTARSDGRVAPAQALSTLQRDPSSAPIFLKRFGYLPAGYQKYLSQHQ